MTTDAPWALRTEALRVTHPGGVQALRGISLCVHEGQTLALVGESGSGKSSLFDAVLGVLPRGSVATGRVALAESRGSEVPDLLALPEARLRVLRGARIGAVPQDPYAAFDALSRVGPQIARAWHLHGRRPPPGFIVSAMAAMGLPAPEVALRLRPHQWSGGMLQRAAILMAVALDPQVVLADEPTSALDADLAQTTVALLRARSRALVLITHDLALAARQSDRIAVLYAGQIVEEGPARTLLDRPRHPYTQALVAALPGRAGRPQPLIGAPPDPRRPSAGCAFAPRCAQTVAACQRERPAFTGGLACHVAGAGPGPA